MKTKEERIKHRKEYLKQYNINNKEKIKQRHDTYLNNNKEAIKKQTKSYRENNKETIKNYQSNYYRDNVEKIKERNKQYHIANKENINEKKKQYHIANKENINKRSKEYYFNNPDQMKNKNLLRNFNITLEQYNEMFDKQEGKCAICGKHQNKLKKALSVDHDHKTGQIRNLLCNKCNNGIGFFEDNIDLLEQAINYLKKHS